MKIEKVGLIEKNVISGTTKSLTNKQKLKLADKMFKDMYQGKVLTYKKLKEEMFVCVNKKSRINYSTHKNKERNKAHIAKLEIAADGQFIAFVSNPEYTYSKNEKKNGKSANHKKNQEYHYFIKEVYIDEELYKVLINVQETTSGKYIIYHIEMLKK